MGKSDFSFYFKVYEEEEDIIIKLNSKVDLLSDNGVEWLPAIIHNIEPTTDGTKLLSLVFEGGKKCFFTVKQAHISVW